MKTAPGHRAGSGLSVLRAIAQRRGITPHAYQGSTRITRAKELLAAGMQPAAAAVEVGFSDQSHFTNRFKAITGLTPGSCRSAVHKATAKPS